MKIERTATIEATPDAAWAVLADFGAISRWVPLIQHSCLLSDQTEGVGTIRRVQIARQTLIETVEVWQPGQTLAYTIDGLPPIVGRGRNTWQLRPAGRTTLATLTTDITPGDRAGGRPNPALLPISILATRAALKRMSLASELMLAGLAATAPTIDPTTRSTSSQSTPAQSTRSNSPQSASPAGPAQDDSSNSYSVDDPVENDSVPDDPVRDGSVQSDSSQKADAS